MEPEKAQAETPVDNPPVSVDALPAPRKRKSTPPMLPARYACGEQIGRGGIGSVWRVHDRQMNRPLAAKVLLPRFRKSHAANKRLEREAMLAGSLQHPGIPPIYEKGELLSGSAFFTMKLVEGKTLEELLRERSDPGDNRAHFLNIFRQIAETVGYAHAQQVIHRDLKPQNVMVGEFGEVQIMDWGMAKRLDDTEASEELKARSSNRAAVLESAYAIETNTNSIDSSLDDRRRAGGLTMQGDVFGTPHYMSPEQAQGNVDAVSETADVFSLGAILFEIITGNRLYEDFDAENVLGAAANHQLDRSLEQLKNTGSDHQLVEICIRCLREKQEQRPINGRAVAELISSYSDGFAERLQKAELESVASRTRAEEEKRRRRLTTLLAATVVATMLLGVAAYIWYQADVARMRTQNDQKRAQTLIEAVATAPASVLPFAIENLRVLLEPSLPLLKSRFDQTENDSQKLQLAMALSEFDEPQTSFLVEQIGVAEIPVLESLAKALQVDSQGALALIKDRFAAEQDVDLRARYAAIAMTLGDCEPAATMTGDGGAVNDRVAFVALFDQWQVDDRMLLNFFDSESDPLAQYSAMCAVGELIENRSTPVEQELIDSILRILRTTRHANVRAAAELAARRGGVAMEELKSETEPETANWYVNSIGMNMIRIELPPYPDPGFRHYGGYAFYIADRETTHSLFQRFLSENPDYRNRTTELDFYRDYTFIEFLEMHGQSYSGPVTRQTPQSGLEIYHAIEFCNWLSLREGLEPYYINWSPKKVRDSYAAGRARIEQWQENPFADGYRLPSLSEYDYLAGGQQYRKRSPTFLNADQKYHRLFEWYLVNSDGQMHPGGQKLPNRFGIFDLMGNLIELGDQPTDWSAGQLFSRGKRIVGVSFSDAELRFHNATGPPLNGAVAQLGEGFGFRVVRRDKQSLHSNPPLGRDFNTIRPAGIPDDIDDPVNRFERLNCVSRRTGNQRLGNMSLEYGRLGLVFQNSDRDELAIRSFRSSGGIARQLADAGHRPEVFETVVGGNLVNTVNSLIKLEKLEQAGEIIEEARSVLKDVVERYPDYERGRQFLQVAEQVAARVQTAQGTLPADDQADQ